MDRVDDPDLGDETVLWRRVLPGWLNPNEGGEYRPQSLAFVDRLTHEVSVFVADLTDVVAVMNGRPDESLVAITAGVPRTAGGIVAKTPENPDPAHRVLCYPNDSRMKKVAKIRVYSTVTGRCCEQKATGPRNSW